MPFDVQCSERADLAKRFLRVVFGESALPMAVGSGDGLGAERFADRNKMHIAGIAAARLRGVKLCAVARLAC